MCSLLFYITGYILREGLPQPALKPYFKFDIEEEQGAGDSTVQQEVRFSTASCELRDSLSELFPVGTDSLKAPIKIFYHLILYIISDPSLARNRMFIRVPLRCHSLLT